MTYDPFARGPQPVGVRTVDLDDASRGRRLVAEVWYPATGEHAGADLDPARRDSYELAPGISAWQAAVRDAAPAPGARPLVVFSHGFAGHRRQSTFFTTHLASHGYVVASVDHAGNTFADLLGAQGRPMLDVWRDSMEARPRDVTFLIDAVASAGVAVDTARVGMTGHSFGGWTAVRVIPDEPRVAAVVALAPAIGPPALRGALDLAWNRHVPLLAIAAERDSLLPHEALAGVVRALPPPAHLITLLETDHLHFCDAAKRVHELFRSMPVRIIDVATPMLPFAELAPARHAHDAACGLGLAHLDAHLRDLPHARTLLAGDLLTLLAGRGIRAE